MRKKIEIIAECGINHNGDMLKADYMIAKAKSAGADVAKFQLFNAERLIEEINPGLPDYNKKWVQRTELNKDQLAKLVHVCKRMDIEFMASAFDVEMVEWLEEVGVKRHKIPKFLSTDEKFCRKVMTTGKQVIVSADKRLNFLMHPVDPEFIPHPRVSFLYCIAKYPASLTDYRMTTGTFRKDRRFDVYGYDGVSDHTVGISCSVYAMSVGARIVEKHFTLDRGMDGPDHSCSCEFNELWELCKMRDDIEILRSRK